ncbi:MAG: RHS repeat-associated core domain-containing protein, partial [Pseudanabaena sp.]
ENNIRVSQKVDGVETRYLIDDNRDYAQVLEEYKSDGTMITTYIYGHDLISENRNGVKSFYIYDGLGSTRALTDAAGTVTDSYNYDAYGTLLNSTGSSENSYRFAGEQFDKNLNQYYLRDRYYNQGVGRFTRQDTHEGLFKQPLTLHDYLYANANPSNFTDPSGFTSLAEFSAADSIRDILTKTYLEQARTFISVTGSSIPGGQSLALALALIDAAQFIRSLPTTLQTINGVLKTLTPDKRSSVLYKHLPIQSSIDKQFKTDGKAYIFKDQETFDKVANDLLNGESTHTGLRQFYHRFGKYYNEPIGELVRPDGSKQLLYYAEIKIRDDGAYHLVPRLHP